MSGDHHDPLPGLAPGIERTMSYRYECVSPEHEADLLEALCEGFVRANQIQIRAQEEAYPCCLGCGNYRYVPPANCAVGRRGVDRNCQAVLGAAPMHRTGKGTCIDLACLLAAIIREKDGDRTARVGIEFQFEDGAATPEGGEIVPGKYHAIVVKKGADGEDVILDPQRQLEELAGRQAASKLAFDEELSVGASCGCASLPTEETSHA